MSRLRLFVLTAGPLFLIAGSIAATTLGVQHRIETPAGQKSSPPAEHSTPPHAPRSTGLSGDCRTAAAALLNRLPNGCHCIVRAPFVLAGDISEQQLDWMYRDTLAPTVLALNRCYFDHKPDCPILIVMLSGDARFLEAADALDRCQPLRYAGYYVRSERRIVLNLATGYGTLAHELTHALGQTDFPDMPEWFDEGLAALHEEARFSPDGLQLIGLPNWRLKLIVQAVHHGELPPLEQLITNEEFRGEGEGLNYACVRGFCCYLQDRGLLSHFYRKFRTTIGHDATGTRTLCEVAGVSDCSDIDRDFRAWILKREQALREGGGAF